MVNPFSERGAPISFPLTSPHSAPQDIWNLGSSGMEAASAPSSETGDLSRDEPPIPLPPVRVIVVESALDFDRHPHLYRRLEDAIRESFDDAFILDLYACSHINKAALGELVHLVRAAQAKGIRILLARPSPPVARLLETTRLTRFFSVFASLEAARMAARTGTTMDT